QGPGMRPPISRGQEGQGKGSAPGAPLAVL
ncbi:uncharacterized protein WCI35_026203, partial [Daubentonia madagascariensis]